MKTPNGSSCALFSRELPVPSLRHSGQYHRRLGNAINIVT